MLELIVVIVVAMILTSMLLPAMTALRESVNRVVCSSNMRQVGMGVSMYATSRNDVLPHTKMLEDPNWLPNELMGAHHGDKSHKGHTIGWDGLGLLFHNEYCGSYECFYCPSHKGAHPMYRYAEAWAQASGPIYMNYHYAGQRDWASGHYQFYRKDEKLVLMTDGLRTVSDFNHGTGMNVLHGDLSVRWRADLVKLLEILPDEATAGGIHDRFASIWSHIQTLIAPHKLEHDQVGAHY